MCKYLTRLYKIVTSFTHRERSGRLNPINSPFSPQVARGEGELVLGDLEKFSIYEVAFVVMWINSMF